jgi:hypothetical protein
MTVAPLTIVKQWHDALNNDEVDEMVTLVHPHVEIGGPRGSTRGAQVVREWFGRANVRLLPRRWFVQGNQVVVEELGEWLSPESGEIVGSQIVATAFQIDGEGKITRIVRHDALLGALEDVCLMLDDEVTVE